MNAPIDLESLRQPSMTAVAGIRLLLADDLVGFAILMLEADEPVMVAAAAMGLAVSMLQEYPPAERDEHLAGVLALISGMDLTGLRRTETTDLEGHSDD